MYLDYDNTYWVIDVEGDSLSTTKVWCLCYENCITEEKGVLTGYEEIRNWFAAHSGHVFVGHNILKFDAPCLNRLVGTKLTLSHLVDTLVLATLYNPSISGGHSLGAWARRFGLEKIDFQDWTHLSPEMIVYCQQDVTLTKFLFKKLVDVLNKIGFSEKSCWIQHRFIHILKQQQQNGFYFDEERAHKLLVELRDYERELKEEIYHVWPPELKHVRTFKKAFRQDGSYSKLYLDHERAFPKIEIQPEGSYEAYDWVSFNIGSPDQRVQKLLELGWQPREFTPKGNPKTTDHGKLVPSLAEFAEESGIKEVELIATWININSRGNMVGTWLDAYNPETHCIHGNIQIAQTLRLRHNGPNTANIPAVRIDKETGEPIYGRQGSYTYEARDLWCARPGRVLVGTDAKSLEYRMLAHEVNNDELSHVVLTSDVHVNTQLMADLESKAKGKTLNFAVIYGASDKKAGSIVDGTAADGKRLKEKLFANIPGLEQAIKRAQSEQQAGRVSLIDGSRVICPAKHAAFNYKLQGGGARVMAQGAIFLENYVREKGLDSLKVNDVHDEWQWDVEPTDAKEHSKWANQAIRDAGEELNTNIPMDGESKIGRTWACTH